MSLTEYDLKIIVAIKHIRQFKNLSVEYCAAVLNITSEMYSRIEKKNHSISLNDLKLLSIAYGINICDVIQIAEKTSNQKEANMLLLKIEYGTK